jgi:hypothetical protein
MIGIQEVHSMRNRSRAAVFWTAASLIAATLGLYRITSASPASAPLATIVGTVRDQATQAPIPGAWVCFAELMDEDQDGVHLAAHGFTNASGAYSITMPSDQVEWFLSASAAGYANAGGRKGSIPTQINFELYADPSSHQFWGQLTAPAGVSVQGTPVFADLDESDIVSVTDELGRFALVVEEDSSVPLVFQSIGLGIHRYEVAIDTDVPSSNPTVIPVHAAIPQAPVSANVTYQSSGNSAVAGTELHFIGTDSAGVVRFEGSETMAAAQTHTTLFAVPSGLDLRIVASGDFGWGQSQVTTPVSGPVSIVIDDGGNSSLEVTLLAEVGLVDMGRLVLEVLAPPTLNAPEVAVPIGDVAVTAGAPIQWTGLPPATYRLRHRTLLFDRIVDEVELSAGAIEERTFIALAPPSATPGLGSGTGTLSGTVGVPQPGSTVIDVYLTDPLDGRLIDHAIADSTGAFTFDPVPAGDWTLHAEGLQSNGVAFRQLGGAIDVAVATDDDIDLPVFDLTQSIGIAIRAFAIDPDGGPDPLLTTLDTYIVRLHDSNGEVVETQADGFNLLAIGNVSPTVYLVEVDALQLGRKSFTVDLSNVDPATTFKLFDVIVQ